MTIQTSTSKPGLLPNFCSVTVVFMLVLLVELLALMLAFSSGIVNFWERLALISMFAQWLALLNAALLCNWRQWLNSLSVLNAALISFCIMLVVTFIFSLAVLELGRITGFYLLTSNESSEFFLIRNLVISGSVYAVVLRYFYIQLQWQLQVQAQSRAQIQALKARIRPHFLFNSMNTIASLIAIDAGKAEKAVEDLSELFRASLQDKTEHSLAQEIALTRSYLDIESLRLGDRLQVTWEQADNLPDMEIPALCLQPLVENAIYHGIEPLTGGGVIKISAQIENNRLCLIVTNPLSGSGRMKAHKSNHMAQDNIKQRLTLMYGHNASFETSSTADTYTVTIKIPLTPQGI